MDASYVTIILAVIAAVTSTTAAYVASRNHDKLTAIATLTAALAAAPAAAAPAAAAPAPSSATIVVNGVTYTQVSNKPA